MRRSVKSGFDVCRETNRVEKSARRAFAVGSGDLNFNKVFFGIIECGKKFSDILKSEFHRQNFIAEVVEILGGFLKIHL